MKKILTLLSALLALTACQDDLGLPSQGGNTADGLTDIYLAQPDMPLVITRADGSTDEEDSRVESVILFVFDQDGNLLNQEPVQQSVTPVDPNPDNGYPRYRFRAYLPSERHSLYAVCNYDAPDELIRFVKNKGEGTTYSSAQEALQAYVTPAIASAEDAYKGVYVMEGHTEDFAGNITIPVKRILSRHTFTITFDPVVEGDGFKLSSVSLFNVPRISKLVDDPDYTFGDEEATDANRYTNWTNDAVWFDTSTTGGTAPEGYYLGTDPGDYATGEQATDTELLDVQQGTDEEGHDTYTATAHLYENRRGAEPATEVDAALLIDATDGTIVNADILNLDGSPLGIDSTMPATEAQVRYDGHSLLLPEGCSDVRVYSLSGVLVFAQDVADARTVSLDRLPQGVYLYMVNTPEGIATGKLAK